MGLLDWASSSIRVIKEEIHKEICDPDRKCLKETYQGVFDKALTIENVQSVSAAVATIITALNPYLLISAIVIYVSVWIIKLGANHWCSIAIA